MDIASMIAAGSSKRMPGLASGLPVDDMIKGMLMRENAKVDKTEQDKTYLEFKQESYRELIKGMKEFQKYFDPASDKFISKSVFRTSELTPSSDKYFSVSADGSVQNGTYKVKVNKIAESAKAEGESLGGAIKIENVDNWSGKVIAFKVGDDTKTINIDAIDSGNSIDDFDELVNSIKTKIAADPDLKDSIKLSFYEKDSKKYLKFENISEKNITIQKDGTGGTNVTELTEDVNLFDLDETTKLSSLGYKDDKTEKVQFKINDKLIELTVDEDTTIKDLQEEVKEVSGGGVELKVDQYLNKLVFETTNTGESAELKITELSNTDNLKISAIDPAIKGQDAQIEMTMPDGLKTTVTSSSNKITEGGLNFVLKEADDAQEIEISVDKKANIDDSLKKIKDFITDYNALVGTIQKKLTEKSNRAYKPLTSEQKKEMKEEDVKNWNGKVKEGILRGDPLLEKMLTNLRQAFTAGVTDSDVYFGKRGESAVGIDTYSDYKRTGQIEVNDEMLKNMIIDNPEKLEKFFFNTSKTTLEQNEGYIGSQKFKEEGVFERIDNIFRDYVGLPGVGEDGKGTLKGAMNIFVNKQYDFSNLGFGGKNTIPDQMYRKQKFITDMQKKIYDKQNRLYQQFAQIEKAMNQLNSQSSNMMSQLGM